MPNGAARQTVLLVSGLNPAGIDEPRLTRLGRTLAQANVTVLTPEILELSDSRSRPRSPITSRTPRCGSPRNQRSPPAVESDLWVSASAVGWPLSRQDGRRFEIICCMSFPSAATTMRREIASKGGKAALGKGTAHEWSREQIREAARKGGLARRKNTPAAPSN